MKARTSLGILAASAALAACSSGSSGSANNGAGNTGRDKVLAADAGTAAKALTDGKTLRASGRASAAWVRTFAGGADSAVLAADSAVRICAKCSSRFTCPIACASFARLSKILLLRGPAGLPGYLGPSFIKAIE